MTNTNTNANATAAVEAIPEIEDKKNFTFDEAGAPSVVRSKNEWLAMLLKDHYKNYYEDYACDWRGLIGQHESDPEDKDIKEDLDKLCWIVAKDEVSYVQAVRDIIISFEYSFIIHKGSQLFNLSLLEQ